MPTEARQKNHPPLDPDDPETAAIQLELNEALADHFRTYLVDSEDQRTEKRLAVYRLWKERYPEIGETRRGPAFDRYLQQITTRGRK